MVSFSLLLILFISTGATTLPSKGPSLNAYEILLPVGTTGKWISLMELSTIRVKEFEALNGKKLSFFEKIGFRLSQRKLRSEINGDGTITKKTWQTYAGKVAEGSSDFHAGGFFLGLLLNIYAIPIVYLIKDENRKRRIRWMWVGLGIIASLLFLIILAMTGGRLR